MYLYNYNNHIFDKKIIDKLLYTNTDIIIDSDTKYYIINFPSFYEYDIIDYNLNNIFLIKKNELNKQNIKIPKLYIYKGIFVINNNFNFISNVQINHNNFYNFFNNILTFYNNNLTIINNILMRINDNNFKSNYIFLKESIDVLEYISQYIYYYNIFYNQINNFIHILDKNNEKTIIILTNINNIEKKLDLIKYYLDNIKTNTIQKVTYSETKTSKILTIIATIFLPISFIVSLLSYTTNKNNPILLLILLIIISLIISLYYINTIEKNK